MMAKFIAHTGKKLPDDVITKLRELQDKEDSPLAKTIYDTMFRNQGAGGEAEPSLLPRHRRTPVLGEVRHCLPLLSMNWKSC